MGPRCGRWLAAMVGLAAVIVTAFPGKALAHGAFPESVGLVFVSERLPPVVVTTFGMLVSHGDAGWGWVCEEVAPQGDVRTLEILQDGTWLVGGIYGLWRSADRCTWAAVDNAISGLYVTQVSRDTARAGRVWLSTSTGGRQNGVWFSDDGGVTIQLWQTFGEGATVRGFLEGPGGAPWYVVGWRDGVARLWTSADGAVWSEFAIPHLEGGTVYPLAVDARDPSVAWLRASLPEVSPGVPRERLLRVHLDGEVSVALEVDDVLTAFRVDPVDGTLEAGGRRVGLRRSTDRGQSWGAPSLAPEAGCLDTSAGERYQCSNNYADGAAVVVGPVDDTRVLLRFGDVRGVEACPEDSTTTTVCSVLWESVKASAGLGAPAPPSTPTPTPGEVEEGGSGCGSDLAGGGLLILGLVRRRRQRSAPRSAPTGSAQTPGVSSQQPRND